MPTTNGQPVSIYDPTGAVGDTIALSADNTAVAAPDASTKTLDADLKCSFTPQTPGTTAGVSNITATNSRTLAVVRTPAGRMSYPATVTVSAGSSGGGGVSTTYSYNANGIQVTLPRKVVDRTYATALADILRTVTVTFGADPVANKAALQGAIDTAAGLGGGTKIIVSYTAGQYANGGIMLRNQSGARFTIIETVHRTSLPAEGTRITNTDFPNLFVIKTVTNGGEAAIQCEAGAHHYYVKGGEFTQGTATQSGNILSIRDEGVSASSPPSNVCHHIGFRHCYAHAASDATDVTTVVYHDVDYFFYEDGIALGGHVDQYNQNEARAFLTGDCNGPWHIENNLAWGNGQTMMCHGYTARPGMVPSDYIIRRNHCWKPETYNVNDPAAVIATNFSKVVKTVIESKNSAYGLIEQNVIDGNWADGQDGYSILYKNVNQSGGAYGGNTTWAACNNITIRDNWLRRCLCGVSFFQHPESFPVTTQVNSIFVSNNVMDMLQTTPSLGSAAALSGIRFGAESGDGLGIDAVVFAHNTIMHRNWGLQFADVAWDGTSAIGQYTRIRFENNLFSSAGNAIRGDRASDGGALSMYCPGVVFTGNALVGQSAGGYSAFPGNFFPASNAAVGFVSFNANGEGNMALTVGSSLHNAGTDGKDVGAGVAALFTLLAGVIAWTPDSSPALEHAA